MDQTEPMNKIVKKRHTPSIKSANHSLSTNVRESSPRQLGSTLAAASVDGFDPNILLNAETGNVIIKSRSQRAATKVQVDGLADCGMLTVYTDGSSLGNGTPEASAGVGIFFGPSDSR